VDGLAQSPAKTDHYVILGSPARASDNTSFDLVYGYLVPDALLMYQTVLAIVGASLNQGNPAYLQSYNINEPCGRRVDRLYPYRIEECGARGCVVPELLKKYAV